MEQDVDLNYLSHRHRVSLYMAEHAASHAARRVHRELAFRYAERIAGQKISRPVAMAL